MPDSRRNRKPYGSKKGTCSSCGKDVWLGKSSVAEPTCHPCRRIAHGLTPDARVGEFLKQTKAPRPRLLHCRRCDAPVPEGRRAYCSEDCGRRAHNAAPRNRERTTSRGYGRPHVRLRAQLLPLAYGQVCHFCEEVMEEGQELHLDHTEDRTGYRGMTHARCNVLDGIRRAHEALRQQRLAKGSPLTRRAAV